MFERIISIVFPVFAIILGGWLYGRKHKPDMAIANRLNLDVFLPALILTALADKSFDLFTYRHLAISTLIMVIGSGILAWPIAKLTNVSPRTFVPPMMFNNSANLGLPLAVLAFGDAALAPAVVMFIVSTFLHFSLGVWLLDHKAKWWDLWRNPVVIASLAGLFLSFTGLEIWSPLKLGLKMLGDISIPLLLFALGVRVADSSLVGIKIGLIGALVRPILGISITYLMIVLFRLQGLQASMLLLFGALPPAVLNYMFSERYQQEPTVVASMVLIGNIVAIAIIPVVLAAIL